MVIIRIGSDEIQCFASYIVDSLTDFVYAALELMELRPPRPVVLFEEPTAIRVSLVGDGDRVDVRITHHPDLAAAGSDRLGTVSLSGTVGRVALAGAIWSALRRLEAAVDERTESEWRRPFPTKELAQLGKRLTQRNARP